ncbi:MAG: hypothetical protein KAR87_04830 [Candidatus Aenigmarchaeota archaeon]|nr:hypothetical protein [Candidatus Aenigmarchaeota archaeon]
MKTKSRVLFFFIIISLLIMPLLTYATVGIGIKWFTDTEFVSENSQKCISYGLYNPFDEDVIGYLTATKGLEDIYEAEDSKLIFAGVASNKSIGTKICFSIPQVYEKDCLIGNIFLCKRTCEDGVGIPLVRDEDSITGKAEFKKIIYEGEVMASYTLNTGGGAVGSATGTSFAAPLKLTVRCEAEERNWMPVYIVLLVLIILMYLAVLKRKKRDKKDVWNYKKK